MTMNLVNRPRHLYQMAFGYQWAIFYYNVIDCLIRPIYLINYLFLVLCNLGIIMHYLIVIWLIVMWAYCCIARLIVRVPRDLIILFSKLVIIVFIWHYDPFKYFGLLS
jgi:hypothetical protein